MKTIRINVVSTLALAVLMLAGSSFCPDDPPPPYVYDVEVEHLTFKATRDMDSGRSDDYVINIRVDVPGYSAWDVRWARDGHHNTPYEIKESERFDGLNPGDVLTIHTDGRDEERGRSDESMGSASETVNLDTLLGQNRESGRQTFVLRARHYELTTRISVRRRRVL